MPSTDVKLVFAESIHKRSEAPRDCQDAWEANPGHARYAIADGVARSFFPAEWAGLLVKHFCNDDSECNLTLFQTQDWQTWLSAIQPKWYAEVQERVAARVGPAHAHLHNSLLAREPAAATFAGVQLDTNCEGEPIWRALLLGDSCLLTCRGGSLTSFPIARSTNFNHHPAHFASYANLPSRYDPRFCDGKIVAGDVMILATDALAKWLISQYEREVNQWPNLLATLLQIQTWENLYRFVDSARNNSYSPLEDDDTTLVVLQAAATIGKENPVWSPPTVTTPQLAAASSQEPASSAALVVGQPPAAEPVRGWSRTRRVLIILAILLVLAVVLWFVSRP